MSDSPSTMASPDFEGQAAPSPRRTGSPYPGLRPFERSERDLFFGRDRDAELLDNRIFASRLTLLFGQSGDGKSSLLRTLLIPQLENEGARVFTFDDWAADEPFLVLLERLNLLLGADNSPGSDDEDLNDGTAKISAPNQRVKTGALVKLARRLTAYDPRPFVLVLDQFEELLLRQPNSIELVRRELSSLVRDQNTDVRILISLREEFLAALEPFRRDIPGLFDSTYRLEPLSDEALRDAIVKPAAAFGVTVDTALIDTLFRDLRGGPTPSMASPKPQTLGVSSIATEVIKQPVSLPMLQLVLRQLWDEVVRSNRREISLDLYRAMGGVRRVTESYVEKVMPTARRDRLLSARLMLHLAPASGYKVPFSSDDLATVTGLNAARIEQQLERLSRAGILHLRKYRDKSLYELQHDAFIAVLRPWRDKVLRKWRRTRLLSQLAGAASILVIIAGLILYWDEQSSHKITETDLAALREMVARQGVASPDNADWYRRERETSSRLDAAARHLLFSPGGLARFQSAAKRFERLKSVFTRYQDLIPPDYGLYYSPTLKLRREPPLPSDWPLVLQYSPKRELQGDGEILFRWNWQEIAKGLAKFWGIPTLTTLKLRSDQTLNRQDLRLRNQHGVTVQFSVPLIGGSDIYAVIDRRSLKGVARDLFDYFFRRDKWPVLRAWTHGNFYAVPRWTLPVWKVAAYPPQDGTGHLALMLGKALTKDPSILLSNEIVESLLRRASESFPRTVAEAREVRGKRLRADLIDLVKGGRSLLHLDMILDGLARYRSLDSPEAARRIEADLKKAWVRPPRRLGGPITPPEAPKGGTDLLKHSFEQAVAWPPNSESRHIRIYLGDEIWKKVVATWDFDDGMRRSLETLRDRIARRFGVNLPANKFRPAERDWPVKSPNGFRLVFLNQIASDKDTHEIVVAQDKQQTIARIIHEIEYSSSAFRTHFITAESTARLLASADPNFVRWLKTQFSETDIKLLLRSVVEPSDEEVKRDGRVRLGETFLSPPGKTIRHAEWLLPALAFFEPATGLDTLQLTHALRDLQIAKLHVLTRSSAQAPQAKVDQTLAAGIDALLQGKIDQAQGFFGDSAARRQNWKVFIQNYAERFPDWRSSRIQTQCSDLTKVSLSQDVRLDVEDLLAGGGAADSNRLQSRLCLYAANQHDGRTFGNRQLLASIISKYPNVASWTVDQASWFGKTFFANFLPARDGRKSFSFILALLESAVRRMPAPAALRLKNDIRKICNGRNLGLYVWCTELLDRLADAGPADAALERAYDLAVGGETLSLAEKSLRFLDRYNQDRRKGNAPPPTSREKEYAELVRIIAKSTITSFAVSPNWSAIERDYRSFIKSGKEIDLRADAYLHLAQVLKWQERYGEVLQLLDSIPTDVRKRHAAGFDGFHWDVAIASANAAEVKTATDVLMRHANEDEYKWAATLAATLSQVGHWQEMARNFILGKHEYHNLMAIIFAAMSSGEDQKYANEFLEDRWKDVAPQNWANRLRDGDKRVWYEMLLGYYLDKPVVSRAEILAALRSDQAFAASQFAALPRPRRGMLCEFHFYDALKAKARGDRKQTTAALQQVVSTGQRNYDEYVIAKYFLHEKLR
jgi:Novel STAND NTPase 1